VQNPPRPARGISRASLATFPGRGGKRKSYPCRAGRGNSAGRCLQALQKWPQLRLFRCSPELVPGSGLIPATMKNARTLRRVRRGMIGLQRKTAQSGRARAPRRDLCSPDPMVSSSRLDPVQRAAKRRVSALFISANIFALGGARSRGRGTRPRCAACAQAAVQHSLPERACLAPRACGWRG